MPPTVTVLTPIPSPYQVELWDAVGQSGAAVPRVVYVRRTHADRQWAVPIPTHDHVTLTDGLAAEVTAREWAVGSDVLVAAWYADPICRALVRARAASGKPWAVWSERPGFSRWPVVGRVRRWWHLAPLRRSDVPIWGIGTWAVTAWKREFGDRREYRNIPYYSDLGRFTHPPSAPPHVPGRVRFLYSGSLTYRKGVDLLAGAFSNVAASCDATLELVGTGPLDGVLRDRLRGLGDRVRFAGFAQWAELPAAYHRADVLVAPSRYDGWGLIVPEGLAAGLPVIGTDRTGAAIDLIRPGVNGWRVRAGDLASLRDALCEAAALTPDRLAAMSAAAVDTAATHQLADGVARFAAAFSSLLASKA